VQGAKKHECQGVKRGMFLLGIQGDNSVPKGVFRVGPDRRDGGRGKGKGVASGSEGKAGKLSWAALQVEAEGLVDGRKGGYGPSWCSGVN